LRGLVQTEAAYIRNACEIGFCYQEHILRAFGRIFGFKREEVAGEWRKFRNEEFNNLDLPPNIIISKSSKMRWAGHVAYMRKKRNINSFNKKT
jgi:hypothetical protein